MPRILHTADWQLGLKLHRLRGERGGTARAVRFDTVEAIAKLAAAQEVDVVVVAGDVFDDNQVSPWVVQRALDALAAFAPIPVVLLPGNHDAAEPGSVLGRVAAAAQPHVHVCLDATPLTLGGVSLHPCPLYERQSVADPTRELPPRAAGDDSVRVAIAHGGVHGFSSDSIANRIDVSAVEAKGFDYLALGDWHGLKQVSPRAWYPGAHEATRFKEQEPGHVLLVELPGAGIAPEVTAHRVAQLAWFEPEPFELHTAEDVAGLDAWLSELPHRSRTLVRIHLVGALATADRDTLDQVLEAHEPALLSLQVRTNEVVTVVDPDALHAPGFLGEALEELMESEDPIQKEAAALLARFIARAGAGAA